MRRVVVALVCRRRLPISLPVIPPPCLLKPRLILLAGGSSVSSKKAAHVFQVRLESGGNGPSADSPLGPAKQAVAMITLRATTHAAKQAWVEQLQAAVTGSGGGAKASTAAPAAAAAVPAALAALSRSSSASASEHAGTGAPAAPSTAAGVPRKISTTIFPCASESIERPSSSKSTAACPQLAAAESVGDGIEGEGAAAAEEALLAAIAAQAAQRQPTPQQAAVLACVVEAAVSYVEAARTRLAGMTQRIISASMLQGRQLRQGLLAVLLPPGATAARLGFDDVL
jgi:hypothetical protein